MRVAMQVALFTSRPELRQENLMFVVQFADQEVKGVVYHSDGTFNHISLDANGLFDEVAMENIASCAESSKTRPKKPKKFKNGFVKTEDETITADEVFAGIDFDRVNQDDVEYNIASNHETDEYERMAQEAEREEEERKRFKSLTDKEMDAALVIEDDDIDLEEKFRAMDRLDEAAEGYRPKVREVVNANPSLRSTRNEDNREHSPGRWRRNQASISWKFAHRRPRQYRSMNWERREGEQS